MLPHAMSKTDQMIGLMYPQGYRRRRGDGGREGGVKGRRRGYEGTHPVVNPTLCNACPTPWATCNGYNIICYNIFYI
jgi:hypothetical protein